MTPEQWATFWPAVIGLITALTALVGAIISALNRRTIQRVERNVNGNLRRVADHLEQARLELAALETRRQHEVQRGQESLAKAKRRRPPRAEPTQPPPPSRDRR